jgi:hypothetical protein
MMDATFAAIRFIRSALQNSLLFFRSSSDIARLAMRVARMGNLIGSLTILTMLGFATHAQADTKITTVTLSAPANNAVFAAASNIAIAATATPKTGQTITKVDFYQGTTLIASDTTSPYSIVWSAVPAGSYSLTAKATTNTAAVTISAVRKITVAALPTVTLTSPVTSTIATLPATLTVSATAAAATGQTIAKVEFYLGNIFIAADTTAPYSMSWQYSASLPAIPAGSYTFTAKVTTNLGLVATSAPATVTVVAANTAPTITLIAPANATNVGAGSNVTLSAIAAAATGQTITKVDFYQGATLLGTATASPYNFVWSNVPAGSYSLTAKVTTSTGLTATSTANTLNVIAAPVVTLTSPANNTIATSPENFTLTATATAASGATISKVDFYNGATLLGTSTTAPYSYAWSNVASGAYTITAKVTDSLGSVTTSTAATVSVNAPPSVTLTSPLNNSSATVPASFTLTANATDSDGTITQVDFFNGATLLGTATTAPYSYSWSSVAIGSYTLTAIATDNLGATATSSVVTVTVAENIPPTISLTTPLNNSTLTSAEPAITAQYLDAESGVDTARVQLLLDGVDVSATATITATSITYQAANLLEGAHPVSLKVYDNAGNLTQAAWQFTVDTLPPVISAQTPTNGSFALTTPIISAAFQDAGVGVNAARTLLTLDGVDITASATTTAGSITYTATTLTSGAHQVVLTVYDLAGNIAQSSWSFSIDTTPPVISAQLPLNASYVTSAAPVISAQYQDGESGIDATKVRLLLDNVDVTASTTISSTGIRYPSANLAEGVHQLVLSVYDQAGNPALAGWQITVDTVAPAISATTPVNGATLTNSTPLVSAQYTDATSGIDLSKLILTQDGVDVTSSAIITATDFTYQSTTTLAQGSHHIALTVVDKAGNSSLSATDFVINSSMSTVAIAPTTTPAGVATTALVTVAIPDPNVVASSVLLQKLDAQGNATTIDTLHDDGLQGDALANDQTYSLSFSIYEQNPSDLTYRVAAQIQGQLTPLLSNPLTFNVSGTVGTGITVTNPTDLSFVNTPVIFVSGTISDPAASVVINGIPANTNGNTFQGTVPLQEGYNPLTATVTNSNGSTATASVHVTLDTTPPKVTVVAPVAGYTTTEPTITVTGIVNDIVVGTVNDQQASVTVNGTAAQVTNRTYTAPDIPLQLGANILRIIALDRTGNSATQSISVTRTAAVGTVVKLISGNNQTGTIASPVAAPLVVQILNGITPVANVPVIFKVTQNDATLQPGAPQSTIVIVNTDTNGQAQANLTLGNRAGAGNNVIEAYSTGATGIAVFTASGTAKPATLISVDSGNNQFGAVNQPLVLPLVAVITDPGHNRLGNIPVSFVVKQGGGTFTNGSVDASGIASFNTLTDSDGRAAASLTLGTQPGQDNNVIEAYLTNPLASGYAGYPAAFTATGKQPGDPLATRISGIVQDNSGQPIADVTMRLYQANLGTHNNEQTEVIPPVITDANGHFTLTGAPVGLFKLMADGKTAINTGNNYPTLEYDIVTVAGQDNTLGMPIYLPALDPLSTLCVDQNTGGTLTLPTAPGFALTIQPGAATFPGGAKSGCVSVTPVNPDKMPMAPGFGQQPRYIVTIQPVGTSFNPPAALTIPNLDGLLPHAKTEMYSYDHDLAAFVAIGSATVSADGSTIASDPGIGVAKAGWHCGGNPNSTGSVGSCPTCRKCSGSSCVADNSQTPPQNSPVDCKQEACINGGIKSIENNFEKPINFCNICIAGSPAPNVNKHGQSSGDGGCCFNGERQDKNPIADLALCPNRVPHPGFVPTANGCTGVPNNPMAVLHSLDQAYLNSHLNKGWITTACDGHDLCYDGCNNEKSFCDSNLGTDIDKVCFQDFSGSGEGLYLLECLGLSKVYEGVVRTPLFPFYDNAQKKACDCCGG